MCIVLYGTRTMPRGLFPSSVTLTVSESGRPRASRHRLAFQHRFIHGLCGLKHFLFAPIRNGSRLCSFGSEESDTRIGIFSYFQESSHATFKRSIIQKLPSFLPGPVPPPFSPDSRNLKGHLSARFCRPLAPSLLRSSPLPLSLPAGAGVVKRVRAHLASLIAVEDEPPLLRRSVSLSLGDLLPFVNS